MNLLAANEFQMKSLHLCLLAFYFHVSAKVFLFFVNMSDGDMARDDFIAFFNICFLTLISPSLIEYLYLTWRENWVSYGLMEAVTFYRLEIFKLIKMKMRKGKDEMLKENNTSWFFDRVVAEGCWKIFFDKGYSVNLSRFADWR